MPLNLKQLQSDIATATLVYAGEDVNVQYKPSLFTPAYVTDLAKREADTKSDLTARIAFLVDALYGVMLGWDVLDEPGGKALPITPDVLGGLEVPFLSAMYQAIMGDALMGKRTGASK